MNFVQKHWKKALLATTLIGAGIATYICLDGDDVADVVTTAGEAVGEAVGETAEATVEALVG